MAKETHTEYTRRWRREHPEQHRVLNRRSRLRCRYNIEVEEYEGLLQRQGGRCAVCGTLPMKKRLAVDHDHLTGKVRGLLCERCNPGLGFFPTVDLLERAKAYIVEVMK